MRRLLLAAKRDACAIRPRREPALALDDPLLLGWRRTEAPTEPMLAHLTPLEMPVVWIAFTAGIALGAVGAVLLRRRPSRR